MLNVPAGGYWVETTRYDAGSNGYYWSAAIRASSTSGAWSMYFDSDDLRMGSSYRELGFSIRSIYSAQIFSLAGGYWGNTTNGWTTSHGVYWSTIFASLNDAWYLILFSTYIGITPEESRYVGHSIRFHSISSSPALRPLCVTLRASKVCLI